MHWKGESYRKPGSLLRKRVFLSKNKIILLRQQSTHSPTCTRTGPDLTCTKLTESSPGQRSFLPPSEAFWNVSSLYDQTAKHLCSPTTPLIRICSLETKTEKGIGKGLRHQLSPVFPESQKHNALQQALKSDRVTGKWWTWMSPHHGGGNLRIIKDFDGKILKELGTLQSQTDTVKSCPSFPWRSLLQAYLSPEALLTECNSFTTRNQSKAESSQTVASLKMTVLKIISFISQSIGTQKLTRSFRMQTLRRCVGVFP